MMKKNLLVLLPALCLVLTACEGIEFEPVEGNECDGVVTPAVDELVTINDFTVSFNFTSGGEATSIPDNASMYIIGSWDNWAEFLPVNEKGGVYTYTFPVIIEGDYEFKGVMWYSDQDVDWTNCVEIVTEEGGTGNATFSTSDGNVSFTRELTAKLEPRNPSELLTKLGEDGSYTMTVEYTESESTSSSNSRGGVSNLEVEPTMGLKFEFAFSYDKWMYTAYELVIPESSDGDDEAEESEPHYELSSTYICFNTEDGGHKDAYFKADGSYNLSNTSSSEWRYLIESLYDVADSNLFDFLEYSSSGTIDDVDCDAYAFSNTMLGQQAYYLLFYCLSSSYVLSGHGGQYAIEDGNISGADFALYYFGDSQAMLMDYVNDTYSSKSKKYYRYLYEYSAIISDIGSTEVDISEWQAKLPNDNDDDED